MTLREHAIALVSVVIGLGLTQLLSNLHELIAARRRVRWYALPLLFVSSPRYHWFATLATSVLVFARLFQQSIH
jgi:hypothetical protein